MPSPWTVVATKEQSVLDDNGVNKGNSQHRAAPVGASTNRRFRELIYAPLFGEWPSDMYQLVDAFLDLTGIDAWSVTIGGGHGASPSITIRASDAYWVGSGGAGAGDVSNWGTGASPVWGTTGTGLTGPTIDHALSGDLNAKKSINVSAYIERILDPSIRKRDGTPGSGNPDHGVIVKATVDTAGSPDDRWGFRTINDPQASRKPTFRILYIAKVPPGVPEVLSPEPGGDPTPVPSDTSPATAARRLVVEFNASPATGDTVDRVELEVYNAAATVVDESADSSQIVTGTLLATTGAVAPSPTGTTLRYRTPPAFLLAASLRRVPVRYRLRNRSQKGAWSRWTLLADGLIQTAYQPGPPVDPKMTVDPQRPVISATLNSPDPDDFVTAVRGSFLRHNSDGTTTNLWPGMGDIPVGGSSTTRPQIEWAGIGLNDGDVVSWTLSLANRDGVWSDPTPEQTTRMQTSVGPTFDPADSSEKLLSRTGPVTINDTIEFDAFRFRLYRNDVLIYTSPITASGPDVTGEITFPAGYVNWGDSIGLEAETRPTSTSDFGPTSPRTTLYIDTLPSVGDWYASDGEGFVGPVLPTSNIVWHSEYDDPDAVRFGEKPVAKELEIREYHAVPASGTLIERRTSLEESKPITEDEETGRTIHLMTSATGWVGDTDVTPGVVAAGPTDYTGNSLRLTFAASATDRGARYTFPEPLDLSRYGMGAFIHNWDRLSSVTNLSSARVRWESATGWVEWRHATGGSTPNVWDPDDDNRIGDPFAESGTMDWTAVVSLYAWLDVTGSYSGTWDMRDLRLGSTAANESPLDWSGGIEPETSVNARVRYRDDAEPLVETTLAASSIAGATNLKLTSVVGLLVGMSLTAGDDEDEETRTITAVGTAGSGGTGVDVDSAYLIAHSSTDPVFVHPWGPWSSWLTEKASVPPVVAASSPADAATVTDPTQDFVHTFTSIKAQALRTLNLYKRTDGVDRLVDDRDTTGTGLTTTAPVLLLEDDTEYAWEIVAYDIEGLYGTTARRTFTTDFTAPDPVENLAATADPLAGTVTLTWDASADANLAFYVVRYIDPDGQPKRIDLGPRVLDDGRTPLLDPTFTYRGARLGEGTFQVSVHNGALESDAAEVDVTRLAARGGAAMLTVDDGRGLAYALDLADAPHVAEPIVERLAVPGRRYPAHFHWGLSGRRVSVRFTYIPSDDGPLERAIRSLVHYGTPVYLALPPGYDFDVMRGRLITGPTARPVAAGDVDLSFDLDEIAPEVPA